MIRAIWGERGIVSTMNENLSFPRSGAVSRKFKLLIMPRNAPVGGCRVLALMGRSRGVAGGFVCVILVVIGISTVAKMSFSVLGTAAP